MAIYVSNTVSQQQVNHNNAITRAVRHAIDLWEPKTTLQYLHGGLYPHDNLTH